MNKIITQTDKVWFGYFEDITAVCCQANSEKECSEKLDKCLSLYINHIINSYTSIKSKIYKPIN